MIAVGHGTLLFCHERAFLDQHAVLADLAARVGPTFRPIVVRDVELSVADAVATYLFNSQLLTNRDGQVTLVAPRSVTSTHGLPRTSTNSCAREPESPTC